MRLMFIIWLIPCAFLLIAAGTAAVQFLIQMRTLDAHNPLATVDTDRYRPMLRLLSDEDNELTADPRWQKKLRTQRCDLFREYLRCLAGDYGQLLAGLRLIMTQSSMDRPDLAKTLFRNRVLFAIALCRIDFSLRLYGLGIGRTETLRRDVTGLMDSLNILRGQFSFLTESAVWGA